MSWVHWALQTIANDPATIGDAVARALSGKVDAIARTNFARRYNYGDDGRAAFPMRKGVGRC